ncbi:MAG: YlbF family regulator [Lachnospiraceae bacterium]|nr:YlbF family regulator [Ruminococcus sp.]MCM1274712.1 YlbF family regulator [Lachnospiraceae bacterium]
MTVIEAARELGKVVQADERYIEYISAKNANDADTELQDLIGEFNLVRQNLAMESDKPEGEYNAEKVKELTAKMHSAYDKVMSNENMAAFTVAKQGMDKLMSEINTILTYSVEGEDPATCPSEPPAADCTGSCSTCGGCG